MNFEEAHQCAKSEGKIVCIMVDKLGNEYCGYCHERVDYKRILNNQITDPDLKEIMWLSEKLKRHGVQ